MVLDKFREECGLVGVWNNAEAANLAFLSLYAQQHRGQEGAGVISSCSTLQGNRFSIHKGLGLVSDVFTDFDFSTLPGDNAIGHVRYTTAGGEQLANVQPFFAEIAGGKLSLAHNGNLTNADELRSALINDGAIFSATSDTEVLLHLIARAPRHLPQVERLISALTQVEGAYSLVIMWNDRIFAVRDPNGFRPLALATLGEGLIVASETCAFDLLGAKYIRDIEPGEILEISGKNETKQYFPFGLRKPSPCIFEYVYFARPDSSVFGRNVYGVRKRLGEELAKEHPVVADMVIPVPDSGVTAAIGYSQQSGIPLELGLIRNHYVGRTFIEPRQSIRDFGVKLKLNSNTDILKDRSIVVVDDSLVRGTTSRKLVAMLRSSGAREVHLRISAPPTTDPCYYGIDTPEKSQLIASQKDTAEIARYIGVDTIGYLSLEGLYRAVSSTPAERPPFCDACFSGNYPLKIGRAKTRTQEELFTQGPALRIV